MQLDIGFGVVITPEPTELEYPTLLEFPAPVLRAYIAEKLETLTTLGLFNSRIKDYYDLALLSRMYPFDGKLLADAIVATFRHRGTTFEAEPIGLTQAYCDDPARILQWHAFQLTGCGPRTSAVYPLIRLFTRPSNYRINGAQPSHLLLRLAFLCLPFHEGVAPVGFFEAARPGRTTIDAWKARKFGCSSISPFTRRKVANGRGKKFITAIESRL